MYELILFNIIQNSVKYNRLEGDIMLVTKLATVKKNLKTNPYDEHEEKDTHILETQIIDTGIGITKQRQNMLFIPFQELRT